MYTSTGFLYYEEKPILKLVVEIDQEISNYYRSLVPKWIRLNPQKYGAHISVVRNELPPNMQHWGKYEGELIEFQYDGIIQFGTIYYWLNVFCTRLEEIRLELGLPVSSEFTRPPNGYIKCFHTTIGNTKSLI